MIKLIASDLDGTLLKNGAQELNPELFDIIRTLTKQSVYFVPASGRTLYGLKYLFAPVAEDICYIAENGSICTCRDEIISKGLIDHDLGIRIFHAVKMRGGCHCMLSCESTCYTDSKDPFFLRHVREVLHNRMEVVEDLAQVTEPYLKIAICDFQGAGDIRPYFQEQFEGEIKVVTSGFEWIDFIAPNANKGTALADLASYLGILPEECMAFGDEYNDTEMLQYAGTSYAMEVCAPGVEKYANNRTDSVEEVLRSLL